MEVVLVSRKQCAFWSYLALAVLWACVFVGMMIILALRGSEPSESVMIWFGVLAVPVGLHLISDGSMLSFKIG
jgi:hypothetical protein